MRNAAGLRRRASAAAGLRALPDTPFRSPIADPAEPRVYLSRLHVQRPAGDFAAAVTGLGYDFGLLRYQGASPDQGWQLSLFGSADSIFNLDLPGDALVNADYRLGLPLIWRSGTYSTRLRLYHQSSHLGDELILNGAAPPRIDLSMEIVDGILAWERGGWRGYGGASYVVRRDQGHRGRTGLQAGIDYAGTRAVLAGGRLVGGVDVKWFEQTDWDAGVSAKVGLEFGRPRPERRGLTVLAEAYDGFAPFGQFTSREVRYYGVGLQFDF